MDGYNKSPCLPEHYRNLGRVREIEEREGRKEGRKEGWKEGKEEGRTDGRRIPIQSHVTMLLLLPLPVLSIFNFLSHFLLGWTHFTKMNLYMKYG